MTPSRPSLDDLRIERGTPPAAPRRILPLVLAAILLLLALAAAWWFARPQPPALRTAVARAVSATGAERTVLNASGYVTARREATVSSKVTGKVMEILIEEGVRVDAGQILARLDDTNVRGNLELAQAQLAAAQSALEETKVRVIEAERDLRRLATLLQGTVASQADFDRAETAALAARARLAQQATTVTVAERTVAIWQQQLDDTIIRAPFAGIVTSKNAQPGEMISPMSSGGFTRTGICTVVDMDSREIEIDVNESYINRVAPGQGVEATLDAYAGWKIPCKVIAIIPTADRQKSTVRVRVGFDQLDPRILPQMAVKVAFRDSGAAPAANPARLVLVPKAAVQNRDGRDVVFVVTGGRAERRAVTVVGTQDAETTLSAGVADGETVALDAPTELTDGASVRPTRL
ncbi:efflux RND transporter periplasmic adaptor subunit [Lacunisphaera limnophila]|uniref:efflux RND transporter periplasmic adaptor subunit n=1 Tax=Lacunisphaera limnophila TaxID=1838286 RepID=UPI000859A5C9|nr:efflux RND transporter periplasmic adaptor subunit [Lacunisphaera limnophila]